MSLPEKPRRLPAEYDARAVEQVVQDIYTAINSGFKYVQLQVNRTSPERFIAHMVVLANGTTFDPVPGYGSGLYRRTASDSWRKLLEHNNPLILNPKFAGNHFYSQPTRTTIGTASATLTGAQLLTKHLQYTSTGGDLTTDTGTLIDEAVTASVGAALNNEYAFDFSLANTGSGTATVVAGAGVTTVGSLAVAAGTSALFQCRKRDTNLYTISRFA